MNDLFNREDANSMATFKSGGKDIVVIVDGNEHGSIQAIEFTYDKEYNKTMGTLVGMTFHQILEGDRNLLHDPFNIVIVGANEYDGARALAIKNAKVSKWTAAISVDDTWVDERVEFVADGPPTPWTTCEFKSARTETK